MTIPTWKPPTIGCRPVLVLGAGVLGRRIACILSAGGYNVHIRDPSIPALEESIAYVKSHSKEYAEHLDCSSPRRVIGKVLPFTDLEAAVKDAWLVIEAVPEKLHLKIEIFGELDRLAPADCIFGSNSSSYKSNLMLDKVSTQRRKLILNVHFSMPPKIRTVELMTDGYTSPAVLDFVRNALEDCAMLPVIARKESTG
jgi:3-hydroxyacyl-CoA dehydrogenase